MLKRPLSLLLCYRLLIVIILTASTVGSGAVSTTIHKQPLSPSSPVPIVKFGIDNLVDLRFEPLRGRRVALVCNTASRTRFFRETLLTMLDATGIQICALIVPEDGYFCTLPAHNSVITSTAGIPVYELIGSQRRPTQAMLADCDAVVIDLQDIGLSTSPIIMTLYDILDVCAEHRIPVYLLDRPNPLGGIVVDGLIADTNHRRSDRRAKLPIPYIHGMTLGELALMINEEGWLSPDQAGIPRKCSLTVIKMRRWRRTATWEAIASSWIPTSPEHTTVQAIRGMALFGPIAEIGAVGIEFGTQPPYCMVGAPDWNDNVIAAILNFLHPYPIKTDTVVFTPRAGTFAGKKCRGIAVSFDPAASIPYYSLSRGLMEILSQVYPPFAAKLYGRGNVRIANGDPTIGNLAMYRERVTSDCRAFRQRRLRYLLYP